MALYLLLRPSGQGIRHDAGFLLGAVSAALLVLTIAGASLTLSVSASDLSEIGQYRLPRPALSLAPGRSYRA